MEHTLNRKTLGNGASINGAGECGIEGRNVCMYSFSVVPFVSGFSLPSLSGLSTSSLPSQTSCAHDRPRYSGSAAVNWDLALVFKLIWDDCHKQAHWKDTDLSPFKNIYFWTCLNAACRIAICNYQCYRHLICDRVHHCPSSDIRREAERYCLLPRHLSAPHGLLCGLTFLLVLTLQLVLWLLLSCYQELLPGAQF